jgi:hypothetical protein
MEEDERKTRWSLVRIPISLLVWTCQKKKKVLNHPTKHKPKGKTVLNVKVMKITPKLRMDMISPLGNSLFETHTLNFSLNKQGMGFGSLGAHQRMEMGVWNERCRWVFKGNVHH